MVKVVVDDRRGLVQESGSGNMVLDNVPLQVKSSGGSVALKSVSTDLNVAAATTLDFTDAIPANSIVVGVKVSVLIAAVRGGGVVQMTKIGLDGDDDAFDTSLTTDMKTVGTTAIIGGGPADSAVAGFKYYAAADTVRLTFGNAPDDTVGKLRLTVYYHELS